MRKFYSILVLIVSLFLLHKSAIGADRYWVGGTGNWHNALNWSATSGGQGGAGVPTASDNVIFDYFSFNSPSQEVIINTTAYCNNISVTSDVINFTLTANQGTLLEIYGNVFFDGYFTNNFYGTIQFAGSGTKSINFSNYFPKGNIIFSGLNATWNFISNLILPKTSDIYIVAGNINLSGKFVQANNITFQGNLQKQLNISNATVLLNNNFSTTITKKTQILSSGAKIKNISNQSLSNSRAIDSIQVTIISPLCNTSCNGSISVTVFSSSPGPFQFDWSGGSLPPGTQGNPLLNVCNGTYLLTVTDLSDGDQILQFIQVIAPPPIGVTYTKETPTCNGDCNGFITANPVGGTPPYSFLWLTNGQTTQTATGLCAGTYQVRITDSNGCQQTFTTNLTQPAAINPNISFTNITCNAFCNGTASTSPTGGNPPFNYTYSWSPGGQTTQNITNLCPGTYTVIVTDDSLCTGTASVTISQPNPLIITPSSNNISCFGACDGSVSVAPVSGGTSPYTYTWTPNITNGPSAGSLCPGTYSVVVSDALGCLDSATFVLTEPAPVNANPSLTNVLCFGACDGTATSNPIGGTAPFTYLWSTSDTTQSIINLCPGQYTVTATDINGCSDTDTITITEPPLLTISVATTNVLCSGQCNGTATVTINGGTPGYSILWSNGQTTPGITNLCAGNYSVTVTDANGCTTTQNFTITQPLPLLVAVNDTTISCASLCDGVLTSTVSGGTSPYIYLWSNGQTGSNATGLCVGNYSLTVTDANGCTATDGGTVSNPVAIIPNATVVQNASCNGLCNGSVTANPTGGTPPYTYLWMPGGQTSQTATGLCGGQSYTITVTDALGCAASQTITITQPPAFNATVNVTNINCFGQCTGQISLGMSGGTSPYSVVWNTVPVQTGTTAVGLCAGTYTATITDNNGCVYTATGTVTQPNAVQANATFTNVTCNSLCNGTAQSTPTGGTPPFTFLWTPGGQTTSSVTGLCAGQYIVSVTDALGCIDRDTIIVTEPLALNATINNVAATCSTACDGSASVLAGGGTLPYSYLWSNGATTQTVNNLCIGNYTVTVTDANGCQITIPVSIVPVVNIVINTTGTQISCFGACNGQATATAAGGSPPYTYSWNTIPVQTGQTAFGLCAGAYTVTVTDANGCFNSQTVTLTNPPQINLNISSSNATCGANCNGSAVANATGGTGSITYQWNTLPVTNGPTLNNLCAGTYTVTATDANGCSVTDSVTINAPVAIQPNPTITQSTCGNSDGAILLNPTGGTAPYTFVWQPGNSTANPLTGIPAGIYTAIITDAVACTDTFLIIVNNILGPIATTISTDASCFGACDGQISSSVFTGTPPFTYLWTPGGQTTPTATNLCVGVYTLVVTDNNGCQGFALDTIAEPTQIFSLPTITNVTCAGFCDGAITVSPTGGTAPYTFLWNTGATTATISGLCTGQYIVTITDATGCSINDTITVGNQFVINPNAISSNVSCNSICDGLAGVNPSGGTPPYTYVWFPFGPNAPSQSGLCAGNYTVTITDANGCTANQNFNITQPNAITLTPTIINNQCFGQSNGSISIVASGGSGTYTYFWLPGGQTTSSITNLLAGNYTVTVSDPGNPGCSETQTYSIVDPPQLTVVATSTNATCNALCDGTLTASANGGTAPLNYTWNPGGLNGNAHAGICAGTYTVIVTDLNGCSTSASTTITQPTAITISFSSSNVTCNSICNGTASVNPSGGTAPYSVLWSTGATGNSVSGLCAGNYSVTVTDASGCTVTNNFTITQPSAISATFSSNNPLCGQCNGSATIVPNGGVGPYTVTWITSPVQNGVTATNLCAGLYDAIITDANGCLDTVSVPVSNQGGPLTSHTSTNAICNGDCNGTATVTATGVSPITYLWIPGGFTTNSQSSLCANTYNVQVTDSLGCITFETIVINQPQPINSTAAINNISCNGLCNGAITITTTGGTSGYTYSWSSGQNTQNINGLCAGQYIVTVFDSQGCTGIDTFNVTTPNVLTFTQSQSNISCGVTCDGIATVNISGGTSPYTVAWSTGQNFSTTGISTISSLCAGTYTANITDINGCTATANFTINPATPISLNPTINNILCNGVCNGSITIAPSGGNLPYSILWSNGGTGNTISNLCPGVYSVTVTDASGCTASQTFTIIQPMPLTASITGNNISCNGACDGQATVVASGGTAPYFYQWNGGQTSATINNLCSGNYSVQVIDNNGCTVNTNVQITQPSPIVITTTSTQPPCGVCNGALTASATGGSGAPYTFLWNTGATTSSISGICAGLYNVTVTDNSGCSQQIGVPLSNSNGPAVTANVTNASCSGTCDGIAELTVTSGTAPFTYNWSPGGQTTDSIGGLCPGTYFATVTDAGNCITVQQVTIATSNPITATASATNAACGQCNGTASVSPSGGTAPFTYIWSNGATTQSVTGLCAGVYQVLITDANGCSITQNVAVGNTGGPTNAAITTTPVTCFGGNNGSASVVNVFGGTAPYSYLWVPGGQTTATVTGLTAGSYNVEIRDANGCIHVELVTITSPTQIVNTANISSTPCLSSTGQISLTTSGGTGPYSYSWNTGQNTATISNLPSGIYIVTVTDAIGCTNVDTFFVNDIGAPLISVATTNINCNGNCNGSATVTASGGSTGVYSYSWTPGGQTTSTISNLCAGNYVVQVTDNGCSSFATALITQPSGFSFSLPNVVSATCATSCNGSATVLPIGGTLPYTYVWTPSGQTTQTANNLCSGLNSVAITDANGCTATQSVIVNDGLGVTATFTTNSATCGQCNGSATVTPSGGTAPYNFLWANGTTSATNSGLCAGVHAVQVTDANGCSTTINVVINNTNAPSGVITAQTNVACFGGTTGAATISASGGTAPYNFLWVPAGQTSASVNNLSAGTYNVEIQDAVGCIGIVPVTITQPSAMNVNPVITNANCGQCNGAVSIFVNGGTAPYTYAWSNGLPATSSQSGLCAQLYTVTVTDANSCSQTFAIPVGSTNGPNVVLTSNNVSCNAACDGSISATATGGSGNYSYLWTPGAQTSSSVNGLCPGTYVVQVTDNTSGCISFNLATITQPNAIHLSIPFSTNASCGGTCNGSGVVMPVGGTLAYTYVWSNGETTQTASALCAGNVSVTVTDANGCTATQNLTITEPPALVIDTLVTQPSCSNTNNGAIDVTVTGGNPPYSYQWSGASTATTQDLINLFSGTYTLTVTDASGCSDTITLQLNPLQTIAAIASSDTAYCDGNGPATLSATGGTSYQWILLADGSVVGNTATVSVNPAVGVHTYVVQVNNGVCVAYDTVIVTVYALPYADAGTDVSIIRGGSVLIGGNPTGPQGSTYAWAPSETLNSTSVPNPVASPVNTTTYYVTVTSPQGCIATDSVIVDILPDIIFPNGFTPNGDGVNDVWIIDNIQFFPNNVVEVYNRWGELLFRSEGYKVPWDGKFKGKDLPVGTYYYVIDLGDDRYKPYTGPLTIMR